MEKNVFKIEKNEKLIAILEKRKALAITNNYYASDGLSELPEALMGKPVKPGTIPKDNQVLIYNNTTKQWEPVTVATKAELDDALALIIALGG